MRKYVHHLAFSVTLTFLPIAIFSWWAEPIYGDLTRIGKWAEHDFGPNALHPTISIKTSGKSLNNANVVVLGDSFSARNLWQSVLSDTTGHVVKTFDYGQNNCIPSWLRAAIADTSSKFIIIETVEREFIDRFNHIPLCFRREPVPIEVKADAAGNRRPTWPLTFSFSYNTTTAINMARFNFLNEKYSKRFNTVNASLRNECAFFSNRRKDRFLYYADDDLKQQWSEQEIHEAISNVLKIQNEVERSGKKFIFIIAPDKSTVYQTCLLTVNLNSKIPNINELLIASGVNAPNMVSSFEKEINTIVDLYDPDNTHWSEAGYILAGKTIGHYIPSLLAGH